MKSIAPIIRRQRIRKDKVRASFLSSKKRGALFTVDLNSHVRSITNWTIGDHFELHVVDLKDRYRFEITPAVVNGYRLSSSGNRRARLVFPLRTKYQITGSVCQMKMSVMGDNLCLEIDKKVLRGEPKKQLSLPLFNQHPVSGRALDDRF